MQSPVLILHILGGIAGLLSGAAAMWFRKGSERHRMYGNVFFVSILTLGASAAWLAISTGDLSNLVGGTFTIYLVATAWITARRRDRQAGIVDWFGFLVALAGAVTLAAYGIKAAQTPTHSLKGVPAAMTFFLATIALLCAAGDIRMIVRGLPGKARIARHLWRMCFALFIASGSFFIARQRIFPAFFREAQMSLVLTVLPLALMVFWLARNRMSTRDWPTRPAVSTSLHALTATSSGTIGDPVTRQKRR